MVVADDLVHICSNRGGAARSVYIRSVLIIVRLSKSFMTLCLGSSKIVTVADFTALALLLPLKL